jgi:poly(A) polymerase Pap1
MYEQLPVPFGLVRYGVAPDHPEVKVFVPAHVCRPKFYTNFTVFLRIARKNLQKLPRLRGLTLLETLL